MDSHLNEVELFRFKCTAVLLIEERGGRRRVEGRLRGCALPLFTTPGSFQTAELSPSLYALDRPVIDVFNDYSNKTLEDKATCMCHAYLWLLIEAPID